MIKKLIKWPTETIFLIITIVLTLLFVGLEKYTLGIIYVVLSMVIYLLFENFKCYEEINRPRHIVRFVSYFFVVTLAISCLNIISENVSNLDVLINALSILIIFGSFLLKVIPVEIKSKKIVINFKPKKEYLIKRIEMYVFVVAYVIIIFLNPSMDVSGSSLNVMWIVVLFDNLLNMSINLINS